jgi:NADH dehydrogenase
VRILGTFTDDLSAYAARALRDQGITVMISRPVKDITETGVTVGGEFIPTATVVWGAGVRASPVAQWLGIEPADRAGRVQVNPDLSMSGLVGVYVLGDAAILHAKDGSPLPGLAQVAHQQGRYLRRVLRDRILYETPPKPFRSRGNLAIIGRNAGVVQWDSIKLKGFTAWLVWGIAHVYLLNGFQNRLLVPLGWLWAYITFERGARLI